MTRAAETSNLETIAGPLRPDEKLLAQLEAHWEQASPLSENELKLLVDLQGLAKPWLGRTNVLTDLESVGLHLHDPGELVVGVFSEINESFATPEPFRPEDILIGLSGTGRNDGRF